MPQLFGKPPTKSEIFGNNKRKKKSHEILEGLALFSNCIHDLNKFDFKEICSIMFYVLSLQQTTGDSLLSSNSGAVQQAGDHSKSYVIKIYIFNYEEFVCPCGFICG